MVSKSPRLFVQSRESTARREQAPQVDGFGERVLDRVREAFCGLHGHDSLLQFEQDRMFLKCVSCGYESPGWEISEPAPTTIANAEKPRTTAVTHATVDERRIA